MRFQKYFLAGLVCISLAACDSAEDKAQDAVNAVKDDPSAVILASVSAFKNNDFRQLARLVMPTTELERAKSEWEMKKNEPVPEVQAEQFSQTMKMLTADGAEEQLMADLLPKLEQFRPQLPMMTGMVAGMAQSSISQSPDLNEEQKEEAKKAMQGFSKWLNDADLGSEENARKAIGVFTATAREINIQEMSELQAMSFDDMLGKVGIAMSGARQALDIYGISVDDILDSVKAETVSQNGENAEVKVSFEMFGQPHEVVADMRQQDGQWFGADTLKDQTGK